MPNSHQNLYHWQGRNLLLDTIVYRKRSMFRGNKQVHCPFDIRRWITPPDDEMMGKTWQQLARRYRRYLSSVARSGLGDAKAKTIWHFMVENIQYTRDSESADHWQFPSETLVMQQGDCEDKAFLGISLMLAAGLSPDRVRVTIGAMVSGSTRRPEVSGHAWPMYRNGRGVWCILEPNLPHLPIRIVGHSAAVARRTVPARKGIFLNADRFADDACGKQYVPLICFNHQGVWTVEQTRRGRVKGARHLEPDWTRNPTFDEILSWGGR